jgi:hypothetical protein
MNRGRSFAQFVQEIERQHKTKVDYLVPSKKLLMKDDANMEIIGQNILIPNQLAHNQIADKLQIPKPYYDRMLEQDSTLLARNVNGWLEKSDETRLVRSLDGKMRSLLSDRYRPLDYYDLAKMTLPAIGELSLSVESSEITDTRMYLKAILPNKTAEIKRGQTLAWGVIISNSEVGAGALSLSGFSKVLQCSNGMTHDAVFRRNHIGVRNEVGGDAVEYFQDDTKKASDKALWLQFRDTLRGLLSDDHFGKVVEKMQNAFSREMVNPQKTVAVVVKKYGMTQEDGDSLFKYLNQGKEFNQNGLVNAITRYAEDQKDYDKSSELESLGGRLLDLTDEGWHSLESEKVSKIERQAVLV